MSAVYFLIPTAYGQQRIAAAHDQQVISLQELVLGDANGVPYSPLINQHRTTLVNQRAAVPVQSVSIADTVATVLATIESNVGGFNIHEIGLTDDTGQLVYIGNYTGAYRPVLAEGGGGETALYMHIKADAGSQVLIAVSSNNVTANRQWVIDNFVSIPVFNAHVAQNTLEHNNLLALIQTLTELLAATNEELEVTQWTVIQEQIDLIKSRLTTLENAPVIEAPQIKAGLIFVWPSDTVPEGYLECAGQTISRTTYADIFSEIGTTYGVGDGSTTFKLPDLRGEFIRGWDHDRGIDAGRAIGSNQIASSVFMGDPNTSFPTVATVFNNIDDDEQTVRNALHGEISTADATNIKVVSSEAVNTADPATIPQVTMSVRPRNVALMYIIKT